LLALQNLPRFPWETEEAVNNEDGRVYSFPGHP